MKKAVKTQPDYREVNRAVYDANATRYELETFDWPFGPLRQLIEHFTEALPGKRVLDLGSGPGNVSQVLKAQGLRPLCVDISAEMLALAKAKGLETRHLDLEKLEFKAQSFDGIWSVGALDGISEDKLPRVLDNLRRLLVENGVCAVVAAEGVSKFGLIKVAKPPLQGQSLYATSYSLKTLKNLLTRHRLHVVSSGTIEIEGTRHVYALAIRMTPPKVAKPKLTPKKKTQKLVRSKKKPRTKKRAADKGSGNKAPKPTRKVSRQKKSPKRAKISKALKRAVTRTKARGKRVKAKASRKTRVRKK